MSIDGNKWAFGGLNAVFVSEVSSVIESISWERPLVTRCVSIDPPSKSSGKLFTLALPAWSESLGVAYSLL